MTEKSDIPLKTKQHIKWDELIIEQEVDSLVVVNNKPLSSISSSANNVKISDYSAQHHNTNTTNKRNNIIEVPRRFMNYTTKNNNSTNQSINSNYNIVNDAEFPDLKVSATMKSTSSGGGGGSTSSYNNFTSTTSVNNNNNHHQKNNNFVRKNFTYNNNNKNSYHVISNVNGVANENLTEQEQKYLEYRKNMNKFRFPRASEKQQLIYSKAKHYSCGLIPHLVNTAQRSDECCESSPGHNNNDNSNYSKKRRIFVTPHSHYIDFMMALNFDNMYKNINMAKLTPSSLSSSNCGFLPSFGVPTNNSQQYHFYQPQAPSQGYGPDVEHVRGYRPLNHRFIKMPNDYPLVEVYDEPNSEHYEESEYNHYNVEQLADAASDLRNLRTYIESMLSPKNLSFNEQLFAMFLIFGGAVPIHEVLRDSLLQHYALTASQMTEIVSASSFVCVYGIMLCRTEQYRATQLEFKFHFIKHCYKVSFWSYLQIHSPSNAITKRLLGPLYNRMYYVFPKQYLVDDIYYSDLRCAYLPLSTNVHENLYGLMLDLPVAKLDDETASYLQSTILDDSGAQQQATAPSEKRADSKTIISHENNSSVFTSYFNLQEYMDVQGAITENTYNYMKYFVRKPSNRVFGLDNGVSTIYVNFDFVIYFFLTIGEKYIVQFGPSGEVLSSINSRYALCIRSQIIDTFIMVPFQCDDIESYMLPLVCWSVQDFVPEASDIRGFSLQTFINTVSLLWQNENNVSLTSRASLLIQCVNHGFFPEDWRKLSITENDIGFKIALRSAIRDFTSLLDSYVAPPYVGYAYGNTTTASLAPVPNHATAMYVSTALTTSVATNEDLLPKEDTADHDLGESVNIEFENLDINSTLQQHQQLIKDIDKDSVYSSGNEERLSDYHLDIPDNRQRQISTASAPEDAQESEYLIICDDGDWSENIIKSCASRESLTTLPSGKTRRTLINRRIVRRHPSGDRFSGSMEGMRRSCRSSKSETISRLREERDFMSSEEMYVGEIGSKMISLLNVDDFERLKREKRGLDRSMESLTLPPINVQCLNNQKNDKVEDSQFRNDKVDDDDDDDMIITSKSIVLNTKMQLLRQYLIYPGDSFGFVDDTITRIYQQPWIQPTYSYRPDMYPVCTLFYIDRKSYYAQYQKEKQSVDEFGDLSFLGCSTRLMISCKGDNASGSGVFGSAGNILSGGAATPTQIPDNIIIKAATTTNTTKASSSNVAVTSSGTPIKPNAHAPVILKNKSGKKSDGKFQEILGSLPSHIQRRIHTVSFNEPRKNKSRVSSTSENDLMEERKPKFKRFFTVYDGRRRNLSGSMMEPGSLSRYIPKEHVKNFDQFLADSLEERSSNGIGKSYKMNTLYKTMFDYMQSNHRFFNKNIFQILRKYAMEDDESGARYGIQCYFNFLTHFLDKSFRTDLFQNFVHDVETDLKAGRWYGYEKLWAYYHYNSRKYDRDNLPLVILQTLKVYNNKEKIRQVLEKPDSYHICAFSQSIST